MNRKDLEYLTVSEMAQAAEDRIADVLLLLDGILGEAEPQTKDAEQAISFVDTFEARLKSSWQIVSPYLHEVAGEKNE